MKVGQTPAVCLVLVLCACTPGQAQEGPRIEASAAKAAQESPEKTEIRGTPYLGGYALFTTTYTPDRFTQIGTVLTPVLLIPFGNKWLIETKFVLDGEYKRDANSMQWDQTLGKNFELIQLDYIASRYLTVVAGRFLTPFGIFNERQHAPWIKKLQIQPFIATGAPSGNGGMLKGAFEIGSAVQLNYAAYFLTVYDIVRFARSRDILCQGRGSAANSAVCFCLGWSSELRFSGCCKTGSPAASASTPRGCPCACHLSSALNTQTAWRAMATGSKQATVFRAGTRVYCEWSSSSFHPVLVNRSIPDRVETCRS